MNTCAWGCLCNSGAYVLTKKDDGKSRKIAASGPRSWPNQRPKETWHLNEEPNLHGRVWISRMGRIMWSAPQGSDVVTVEDR